MPLKDLKAIVLEEVGSGPYPELFEKSDPDPNLSLSLGKQSII
jgi:hypothetical protein